MPWWAVLSAASAPVFLIGGWELAAARQPGGFDPVTGTISALAADGAADRWIMTTGLAGVGVCHVITALGLRSAAAFGRLLLAAGGAAAVGVAAFPQPVNGDSAAHLAAASITFPALSLWPALAWQPSTGASAVPRAAPGAVPPQRAVSLAAASGLLGLLGWFGCEFARDGAHIGLAERVLAGAQSLWPLATVLLARRR